MPPKGFKHSDETKKRISQANTGKKHSPEMIKKIGWYWKGKHLSEEHKHKLSLANKGKKRTQETRDNISKGMRDSYTRQRRAQAREQKKLLELEDNIN
ncbi:MAG: NUMOD3 domain-containing DNA-binding protein [Nitrososphaeraceae archaeon]